jgi:hypothetical protein
MNLPGSSGLKLTVKLTRRAPGLLPVCCDEIHLQPHQFAPVPDPPAMAYDTSTVSPADGTPSLMWRAGTGQASAHDFTIRGK